jgi:NADH:ubiquinone reductase (H+-translocating)
VPVTHISPWQTVGDPNFLRANLNLGRGGNYILVSVLYGWMAQLTMAAYVPCIVIVGGGFGGLAAAKALRKAPARVILIDRNNHFVFQPLLYQVATSVLTPGQIGSPLRGVVGKQRNLAVILGHVSGVDTQRQCVLVSSADREAVPLHYDYLILATGAQQSYFGHDEFAKDARGLKTLADAVSMRNRILQAFEQAETEEDPTRHQNLLTFVMVGAGPTGVELASAIALLVRQTFRSEFRRVNPASARIVLVDRGERVLATFSEKLSRRAEKRLKRLGVEMWLKSAVEHVDQDGVIVGGKRISSKTVIWTAGVAPSPAGKWINAPADHAGRVRIEPNLSVPGHSEIFVIGDTASLDRDGKPLPGVAQVAMQQGRYAGKQIRRHLAEKKPLPPFRYFDKGNMAVVGKGFAVLQTGKFQLSGYLAWLAWAFIHLQFLGQRNLRVSVFVQWVWMYVTGTRGSRLIINHCTTPPQQDHLSTQSPGTMTNVSNAASLHADTHG